MEKCRSLKRYGPSKSRKKDEAYKVELDSSDISQVKDDLFLHLFDERDKNNAIIAIVFKHEDISGKNSLHCNATEIEGKWDIKFHGNIKFSQIILPQVI